MDSLATFVYIKETMTECLDPTKTVPQFQETLNHIIVNLYLVYSQNRIAFLWESSNNLYIIPKYETEVTALVRETMLRVCQTLNLKYVQEHDDPERLLIVHSSYDVNESFTESDLALLLEFGCVDPDFKNLRQTRYIYNFIAELLGQKYDIMTFVCTKPKKPHTSALNSIKLRYQTSLTQVDPTATVKYIETIQLSQEEFIDRLIYYFNSDQFEPEDQLMIDYFDDLLAHMDHIGYSITAALWQEGEFDQIKANRHAILTFIELTFNYLNYELPWYQSLKIKLPDYKWINQVKEKTLYSNLSKLI